MGISKEHRRGISWDSFNEIDILFQNRKKREEMYKEPSREEMEAEGYKWTKSWDGYHWIKEWEGKNISEPKQSNRRNILQRSMEHIKKGLRELRQRIKGI